MYPTDEQLEVIKKWNISDLHGLMEYIREIWEFADWGWKQDGGTYYISTGGWSGNEDIIEAMQSNHMWWFMFWEQSKRGGHYIFETIGDSLKRRDLGISTKNK